MIGWLFPPKNLKNKSRLKKVFHRDIKVKLNADSVQHLVLTTNGGDETGDKTLMCARKIPSEKASSPVKKGWQQFANRVNTGNWYFDIHLNSFD